MASVNVYLVGPPVRHSSDIKDLLRAVIINQLGHGFRDFAIREMRGPVPFRSSWILEGGARPVKRRPGLQCVDLWCVVCVWPPPFLDQPPWSVIVPDHRWPHHQRQTRSGSEAQHQGFGFTTGCVHQPDCPGTKAYQSDPRAAPSGQGGVEECRAAPGGQGG